jgi:hypothetical protein
MWLRGMRMLRLALLLRLLVGTGKAGVVVTNPLWRSQRGSRAAGDFEEKPYSDRLLDLLYEYGKRASTYVCAEHAYEDREVDAERWLNLLQLPVDVDANEGDTDDNEEDELGSLRACFTNRRWLENHPKETKWGTGFTGKQLLGMFTILESRMLDWATRQDMSVPKPENRFMSFVVSLHLERRDADLTDMRWHWKINEHTVLSDVDLKDGYCKRMNRALQADPEGDLSAYVLFEHASDVCMMYVVCMLLIYLRDGSRRAFTLAARDCGCDCTAGKCTCCHIQKGFSALKLVWDGVMDVSDFSVDASSAVYPVTGLAPGFYMQLTDETWPWLWELRALFAMLTYHKDTPIAAAMLGQRGCIEHSVEELFRRRGGRKRIAEMAQSVKSAVLQQSLEMMKEGAAAKKARIAAGATAAVADVDMAAPPANEDEL